MLKTTHPTLFVRFSCQGFSLIELLVAVSIGLMLTVTMAQLFNRDELRNRQLTDASSQTQNGGLAILTLERHLRRAGDGFSAIDPTGNALLDNVAMGCQLTLPSVGVLPVAPVNVANGPNGGVGDTLDIMYGSGAGNPLPYLVSSIDGTRTTLIVDFMMGLNVGDQILVANANAPGAPCYLRTITAIPNPAMGASSRSAPMTLNLPIPAPLAPLTDNYKFFNLGVNPSFLRFTHNANRNAIQQTNLLTGEIALIADNVANFQVQLGVDSDADAQINAWLPATASGAVTLLPPVLRGASLAANTYSVNQVLAVRLGVLTRNDIAEDTTATGTACTSAPAAAPDVLPLVPAAGNIVALPASGTFSRAGKALCYRYRTNSLIVPIPNAVLNTVNPAAGSAFQ